MGISPKQYQKNNGKKDKQPIMGFGDVAGSNETPSNEKEEVKQEAVQTTKEEKPKQKQSTPSTKKEKTEQKKDEPTNEEPKGEVEIKEEKTGNDPVQETPQEPVVEDGKQGEKQDGDSTPTVEDKKDDEPPTPGKNDEEEEEMTQEKDAVLSWLEEDIKTNKKQTKTYFLDKEVIDKIDKIGKKIPKSKGGTGGFVNELLKQALKDRNLW
ncbi:hypothetical protein BCJMU01_p223 (plasmid) [Bacillus cereus]|nr:hypothetical protein BCJMU01_p223 [Bacillus cereus]